MAFDYDATKKRVITARNSSHMQWGPHERTVDRVTAFALADGGQERLGNLLWRLKYGGESRRWRNLVQPAVLLLARQFRPKGQRLRPRVIEALATAAIVEWLGDQCPKCGGRGTHGAGREILVEKRVMCGGCAGRGFVEEEWPSVTLARLTGALMGNEVTPPRTRRTVGCQACHGKGGRAETTRQYSRLRSCGTCSGTGRRRMSKQHRIAELGLPTKLYDKWRRTYLQILREIRATDAELAMRIDFRLDRAENPDDDSRPRWQEEIYDLPGEDEPDEPLRGHPRG